MQMRSEELAMQLDASINSEDITEWLNDDSNNSRYHLRSDDAVVQLVTQLGETYEDKSNNIKVSGARVYLTAKKSRLCVISTFLV